MVDEGNAKRRTMKHLSYVPITRFINGCIAKKGNTPWKWFNPEKSTKTRKSATESMKWEEQQKQSVIAEN